jgi:hypothetical protein
MGAAVTTTERRTGPADVARMLTMGASGVAVFGLVAYLGATDGTGEPPSPTVPAVPVTAVPETTVPTTAAPSTVTQPTTDPASGAVALTTLVPIPPPTLGPTVPAPVPTATTTPAPPPVELAPPAVELVSEQSG